MLKDAQGLVVTTDSVPAIPAINRSIDQTLCDGKDAETAILPCALTHAYGKENSQKIIKK
ncbi:hypothetical protein [Nodularia sp. NIES-3585]|uniref:hypothetical protein n=1 Tax=Nodularia sp. NIES-3585 TaxID=1973477 RepID=UPI000B5C93B1|nr:hypothetical protein [Nodularia sp. NIES-3585]GAX35737.1 hypothetical protein NIES3585_17550 [Nodularia sp. NIES-3585]